MQSWQKEELPNWGGEENYAMYGYIYKAVEIYNRYHPEEPISDSELKKIMIGLRCSTDELTAQQALDYFMKI